jgi:hypothetical protein
MDPTSANANASSQEACAQSAPPAPSSVPVPPPLPSTAGGRPLISSTPLSTPLNRAKPLGNLPQDTQGPGGFRQPTFKVPNTVGRRSRQKYRTTDAATLYRKRKLEAQKLNESQIMAQVNEFFGDRFQKQLQKEITKEILSRTAGMRDPKRRVAKQIENAGSSSPSSSSGSTSNSTSGSGSGETDGHDDPGRPSISRTPGLAAQTRPVVSAPTIPNIGDILSGRTVKQSIPSGMSVPTSTVQTVTTSTVPIMITRPSGLSVPASVASQYGTNVPSRTGARPKTTRSSLYDMGAVGGSMPSRGRGGVVAILAVMGETILMIRIDQILRYFQLIWTLMPRPVCIRFLNTCQNLSRF